MKSSFSLIPLLASLGTSGFLLAHAAPQSVPPNLVGEYLVLWNKCVAGGPNVYVGVQYEDGTETTFSFNQCYPYQLSINGPRAKQAVFCKSATCYSNPNPDCTGGAVPPAPVPVVSGLTLVNVADWVQLLGQGATCQPNGLPTS